MGRCCMCPHIAAGFVKPGDLQAQSSGVFFPSMSQTTNRQLQVSNSQRTHTLPFEINAARSKQISPMLGMPGSPELFQSHTCSNSIAEFPGLVLKMVRVLASQQRQCCAPAKAQQPLCCAVLGSCHRTVSRHSTKEGLRGQNFQTQNTGQLHTAPSRKPTDAQPPCCRC